MRLPGPGARPPPPARRQRSPAAPPPWTSATSAGRALRGRPCGRLEPGWARFAPPPRPLAAAGPAPRTTAPGPQRAGPAPSRLGPLGKPASAANVSPAKARDLGAPASPSPAPARGRVPAQQRSAPSARGRERAPGRAVRCCARAKAPPARPRRPHSPSALFVTSGVAAACAARRSTPRPGAHSSGPGPGTRGSSARRAWRAPARRARSAGPRARSRAPGGGGAKQAARLEAGLDKGHAHCLSLPRSGGEEGGDPGPVNRSKVEEGWDSSSLRRKFTLIPQTAGFFFWFLQLMCSTFIEHLLWQSFLFRIQGVLQ